MEDTELAGFSVPAMECLWVVLRFTGPWELGGGDINIPWYMGEAFPSLHYKVHPKTTSSIHITPFAHLFVFIHMYSFFQSLHLKSVSTYYVLIHVPERCWALVMNSCHLAG